MSETVLEMELVFFFRNTGPGRNFMILVTDGQSYDEVIHPAEQARNQGQRVCVWCVLKEKILYYHN